MASLACPCAGAVWKNEISHVTFKRFLTNTSCPLKLSPSSRVKVCKPVWNQQRHGLKSSGSLHGHVMSALTPQAEVTDFGSRTEKSEEAKVKETAGSSSSGEVQVVASNSLLDGGEPAGSDSVDSVSSLQVGGARKKPRAKRGTKKSAARSAELSQDAPSKPLDNLAGSAEGGSVSHGEEEGELGTSEPNSTSRTLASSSEAGAGDAWPRGPSEVAEASGERRVEGEGEDEPSTSSDGEDPELEKGYKMSKVCDRLVEVFMVETPDPVEWRKLLIFSEEWSKIRPHFYKRCKEVADAEENYTRKAELLKLGRRLKEVEDDMARHDELMALIEKDPSELESIVSRRRKDFTSDFFAHLKTHAEASHKNLNRRDEIATLAARCLTLVEVYDATLEDEISVATAQEKFDSILASPSLEAATEKINELARNKQLDPTLMLLMTKAWAAAKESNIVKEEAKDIMYHLYTVARGNMQRLVPKEVRILRHILSMEDPRERMQALSDAFAPGEETEGGEIDLLYTTPPDLYKWIKAVLDAYYSNRQGTLIKSAAELMNPMVIHRMEALKLQLEDQFL